MAVALVDALSNPTTDGGTQSATQVLAAFTVSVGDIVVIVAGAWSGAGVAAFTIADSLGNTWQADDNGGGVAGTSACRIFSSKITNAGSMVVTLTGSNTYNWEAWGFKLTGANTTTWRDTAYGSAANNVPGTTTTGFTTPAATAGNRLGLGICGSRGFFGDLRWGAVTIGGSSATSIGTTDASANNFGTCVAKRSFAPGAATVAFLFTHNADGSGEGIGADAACAGAVYIEAAPAGTPVNVSDTASLSGTEGFVDNVTVQTPETVALLLTETVLAAVAVSRNDTASLSLNEVSGVLVSNTGQVPVSDTASLSATDASLVSVRVDRSDTTSLSLTDSGAVSVDGLVKSGSDTASIAGNDFAVVLQSGERQIQVVDIAALHLVDNGYSRVISVKPSYWEAKRERYLKVV